MTLLIAVGGIALITLYTGVQYRRADIKYRRMKRKYDEEQNKDAPQ
jgi:hypothetical protein